MNMVAAAKETISRIKYGDYFDNTRDGTDIHHLCWMVGEMEKGEMSIAKTGRWLGWIQACVVINSGGRVTLDDCKEINKKHSG